MTEWWKNKCLYYEKQLVEFADERKDLNDLIGYLQNELENTDRYFDN